MSKLFGKFVEINEKQKHLVIKLSLSLLPIEQNWKNNSQSAEFIADYWQVFFPAHNINGLNRQTEIRDAVSFIANELLENAMKFGYEFHNDTICIIVSVSYKIVRFYITNKVTPKAVKEFQNFIRELLIKDPEDMFVRQLVANYDKKSNISRLGFLTILCHYNAQLGWKFEPAPQKSKMTIVTTMVQLPVQ